MARSRSAQIATAESEFAEIIVWYGDLLERTPPPTDLAWQPTRIGPTWRYDNGWVLPEFTLGWRVLAWCGVWLRDKRGQPWQFTPEQARFVLWYFAIDPATSDFLFHSAVLQRLKGWGKDPIAACLAVVACFGEVTFDHWDGDRPVGRDEPAAWVLVVATSEPQTKNTMKLFPSLIPAETRRRYGIGVGKENVWGLGDTRHIEAVTSSPLAIEGKRPTQVIRNEALALDTIIPTPEGWTTVAEVRPGDTIFGSNGPVRVVHTTPIYEGRACSRVEFEDGTSLVADDGHLWTCRPVSSDAKPAVRTTAQMAADGRRFAVPLAHPIEMPQADLLIDPYVLGYWLGDGDARQASIAVGEGDIDFAWSEMERRGLLVRLYSYGSQTKRLSLRTPDARRNRNDPRPAGIYGQLRTMGLLHNKHVPSLYLRASRDQRLDLLRGLMDSDGHAMKDSRAVFVNQNRRLADAVLSLARSLGYRTTIATTCDDRWASGARVGYRVTFRADEDVNPFLMPRKAARVIGHRRAWKTVRQIVPVESVPVKCIEVASADHLFVAGDGWTLTHNTQNWLKGNGGHEMAGALEGNAAKSEIDSPARMLDICNAYRPGQGSVGEQVREAWEATQGENPQALNFGLMYDSLEAPPDAPLTAAAAPDVVRSIAGDSTWLDTRPNGRIVKSILNPANPPSESRRKWYNQITAAEDARFDPNQVKACATEDALASDDEIVLFGDGSKSDDATGLVACRLTDGLCQTVHVQQPKPKGTAALIDRGAVDLAVTETFRDYRVVAFWFDPSHAKDDDAEGDDRFFYPLCDEWATRYGAQLKRHWAVKTGDGKHAVLWDMTSPARQAVFVPAVEQLDADIRSGEFRFHQIGPSSWMQRHLINAREHPGRFGLSMRKPEHARKIDLAVCTAGARMLRRIVLLSRAAEKKGTPGKGRVVVLK